MCEIVVEIQIVAISLASYGVGALWSRIRTNSVLVGTHVHHLFVLVGLWVVVVGGVG